MIASSLMPRLLANNRLTTVSSRPSRQRRLPLYALLSAMGMAVPSALAAGPGIQVVSSTVTATDMTPAGRAVFFGVSHEPSPWVHRRVTYAKTRIDTDGNGEVAFTPGPDIADISVWSVVDLVTGTHATGAPVGFELAEATIDESAMTEGLGTLIDNRQNLELMVVRPGTAAWHGRAFDGAAGDLGDAEDGWVEVRLADLQRIWPPAIGGAGASLDQLQDGDVVVGIDPVRLDTWSFVFASEAPIAAGGER